MKEAEKLRNLKKKAMLVTAAMMAAALLGGCGQAKIGYIDAERVLKEAPQIKALDEEGSQKYQEAMQEMSQKLQDNANLTQEEAQKAQLDAQRKLQGINQSYALQMRQKLDVALGDIAREDKLDAVVQNVPQQPIAVSGCIDVTDKVIEKLQ